MLRKNLPTKQELLFAITLTTGKIPCKMSIKRFNDKLIDLLIKYRKFFIDFQFNLEILDASLMPAKVHYHGYCRLAIKDIQQFHSFIGKWKNEKGISYFTTIKLVTDLEKWKLYISKQEYIYRIGFTPPAIERYKFTPKSINSSNELLNWLRKNNYEERERSARGAS